MSTTAVFFDRDDTLIRDIPYLSNPNQIELMPGAADAVRILNAQRIPVIIITNQSGIARGLLTEDLLGVIHNRLRALFREQSAVIDGIYYCPHHPEGVMPAYRKACSCRKPEPGMLLKAAQDFGLNLKETYLIGDKSIDMDAIFAVGGKGILFTNDTSTHIECHFSTNSLVQAVQWTLLDHTKRIGGDRSGWE